MTQQHRHVAAGTRAPDEDRAASARPPRAAARRARHPDRVRVAALDDVALVRAMRAEDAWAWSEFHARFRPVLAAFARRARVPEADVAPADALVDEVLADEATRLTADGAPVVGNLAGYLLRAARHKLANLRRAAARRRRTYAAASADAPAGEVVVEGVCSAYLMRVSAGAAVAERAPDVAGDDGAASVSHAVLELAAAIRATSTDEERLLMTWVAEGISHRMIAAWLGVSYDAATKRIWRLCRKLRASAVRRVAALDADARAEVERFLRRAGALPALVAAVSPAAARPEFPCTPLDDADPAGDPAGDAPRARPRRAPNRTTDPPPGARGGADRAPS